MHKINVKYSTINLLLEKYKNAESNRIIRLLSAKIGQKLHQSYVIFMYLITEIKVKARRDIAKNLYNQ